MLPHIFPQGLPIRTTGYIEVLEILVKPWVDELRIKRPRMFQQNLVPSYKAHVSPKTESNLYNDVTLVDRKILWLH